MLTLYYGSGSTGFSVAAPALGDAEWNKLKAAAAKLLTVRGRGEAAKLLTKYPFRIYEGDNDFGDEFSVLYAEVTMPVYVEIEEVNRAPGGRQQFAWIAKTLTELGHLIRFVAVELVLDDAPNPVASPVPAFTTQVVERSLIDAEQLLTGSGPVSAVDRVHTALHGYLRELCIRLNAKNETVAELDVTGLLKLLRATSIFKQPLHSPHTERLAQGLATIVDALNPIRNRGSMAHPNAILLTDAEAMLAINAARSILHYLDACAAQTQ